MTRDETQALGYAIAILRDRLDVEASHNAAIIRGYIDTLAALRSRPAPPDDLDGPRLKTKLDEQYSKALDVINRQREEIERLKAAPPDEGSVMVRIDPVYVAQMRGEGLAGPFSRITLDERGGVPALLLTTEPKPTPDTAEWWRAVAQELGVEIHKLKLAAQSVPGDLVRIAQPGHNAMRLAAPAPVAAPAPETPVVEVPFPEKVLASYQRPLAEAIAADRPTPGTRVSYSCPHCGREYDRPAPAPETPAQWECACGLLNRGESCSRCQRPRAFTYHAPETPAPDAMPALGPDDVLSETSRFDGERCVSYTVSIERNGVVIWRRQEAHS